MSRVRERWTSTLATGNNLINPSIYFLAAVWHSHSEHLSTVEKDTNGDALWVWCYPSVTAELRSLLLRKCCLTDENKLLHTFVFGQYKRSWFYITTVEVQDSPALKKVGRVPLFFGRAQGRLLPRFLGAEAVFSRGVLSEGEGSQGSVPTARLLPSCLASLHANVFTEMCVGWRGREIEVPVTQLRFCAFTP